MIVRSICLFVVALSACSATGGPSPDAAWSPPPGTTWQWQLSGTIDQSYAVAMYDIDLFDTPDYVVASLRADGRSVMCYFSAGSAEDWRPDMDGLAPETIGLPLDGWPGERWIDIRNLDGIGVVMRSRLDLAVAKGCSGVEPDNVDGYMNDTGFGLTSQDQLSFNRWLADEAHSRGLSIGLKNDLAQASVLVEWFDWVLVEQCVEFDECDGVEPFVSAGKAAFGVEYSDLSIVACEIAADHGISLLFKDLDLGAPTTTCP